MSEQRFYNTLLGEHRNAWRCPLCTSRHPKTDNTNTPIRAAADKQASGVTLHRGAASDSPMHLDMSLVEQPVSLGELNDTSHNITVEMTDMQTILMEMRSFRDEMRGEMHTNREHMLRVEDALLSLTTRMAVCETRVTKFEERLEKLEQLVNTKQDDKFLLDSIAQLKADLNDRDQDLLLNDVEVACVPEQGSENLLNVVTILATKLGTNVTSEDIVSAVRVGRVIDATHAGGPIISRPRPIVVRLARRAVRDQLLQAARVRRGITTEGTGLPGQTCRFYVNERLTKDNRHLFRKARESGKTLGWRYIWTREGRIFARQHHDKDAPRYRIRTESDIVRVFGKAAVGSNDDQ